MMAAQSQRPPKAPRNRLSADFALTCREQNAESKSVGHFFWAKITWPPVSQERGLTERPVRLPDVVRLPRKVDCENCQQ
jgi:hypothetical protein